MIASVLIEYNVKSLNKVFDYIVPKKINILKVGHKVIVPFASKLVEGFVLNIHNNIDDSIKYKEIIKIVEEDFYLNDELLNLGKYMSETLVCNLISCYQAMLPRALKASKKTNVNRKYKTFLYIKDGFDVQKYIDSNKRNIREIEVFQGIKNNNNDKSLYSSASVKNLIKKGIIYEVQKEVYRDVEILEKKEKNIVLTKEQKEAFLKILNGKTNKYLLYGVTGSGKTEIYIKLISSALKKGKNAMVLVPEISLTPQIVSRFKSVFKENIAIFHSALSEGEKYDEYRKIQSGLIRVVVGARSAVFTPLSNIEYIIIDECQSQTYKQENNPKYNAIDIAFERSKYHDCKVVLGSATPSLEQFARAKKGVYELVSLTKRISNKFPSIELVDMEKEVLKHNYIISSKLDIEIKNALSRNEQVIILLNRRGYSTFLSCVNCGYVYKCPNCDISLIYHKSSSSFSCRYCGYRTYSTKKCPNCNEEAIRDLGLGTEKLESILQKKYNVSILRMDSDTTYMKNAHQKLINEFASQKHQILVGTQMISKGLNFENATLVGIINADASLAVPDFRSSERAFELISQTSGRVGRFDLPGKVIVQTYNTDHYVYECVVKNNYELFFDYEMDIRKKLKYPPYYYICNILVISSDYNKASNIVNKVKKALVNNLDASFIVLGPSMAGVFKKKNKYHFSIMIKYKKIKNLLKVLKDIDSNIFDKDVNLDININI